MSETLLKIQNLKIAFEAQEAVKGISLEIKNGSTYALVGESGSGKSVTCSAILGLLPRTANVSGQIIFEESDLLQNTSLQAKMRGHKFAYIPQNPLTSLNPVRTIYSQLKETIQAHKANLGEAQIREACENALLDVQLRDPQKILRSYPFELSGGMCQRVMIAMSLISDPVLLLADEPTTALDVTIQAEIMSLLLEMTKKRGLALFLITHDLALVAQSCEMISVIKNGEICETGFVKDVFKQPTHKYTQSLLEAVRLAV